MNINRDIVDEELFELIERISTENEESIDCINFNYPFPLFVFDENMEFVEVISITDDQQFSSFLGNLIENYSISISYPISGTLSNGDLIEINNNTELKEAIDACVKDEYQRRCNNTLRACVWEVVELDGYPVDFEGAYFKINENYIAQFHLDNSIFFGTWTTLYIGEELHLNISLNAEEGIESTWNFDWLVALLSDDRIELENSDTRRRIDKNCSIDCGLDSYQVCELESNPGFAEFILQNYTRCIPMPGTHDLVSATTITFYETEEDALLGQNAVSNTIYTNTTNPQTIFIRVEDVESGDVLDIQELLIEAISC